MVLTEAVAPDVHSPLDQRVRVVYLPGTSEQDRQVAERCRKIRMLVSELLPHDIPHLLQQISGSIQPIQLLIEHCPPGEIVSITGMCFAEGPSQDRLCLAEGLFRIGISTPTD